MKLSLFLGVALSAALFLASCSKEDSSSSTPAPTNNTGGGSTAPTRTQLLTAHKWVPFSQTHNNVDAWGLVDDCERDNFLQFKADGSFIEDEGATKCKPTDPQTVVSSTWKFTDNQTKVEYNGRVYEINWLTADELTLEHNDLGTAIKISYKPQ